MKPSEPEIHIRPLVAADIDRVQAIASSLPSAPNWPRSAYETALNSVSRPRRVALIAANSPSSIPVGFIVASLVPPQAELESVAVDVTSQRKGLGRQLLKSLITELRLAGVSELTLEVRSSNSAATRFYKALGFHFTGLRPRYYIDPIENAVMMALSIE